jgi:hypothetical protein
MERGVAPVLDAPLFVVCIFCNTTSNPVKTVAIMGPAIKDRANRLKSFNIAVWPDTSGFSLGAGGVSEALLADMTYLSSKRCARKLDSFRHNIYVLI